MEGRRPSSTAHKPPDMPWQTLRPAWTSTPTASTPPRSTALNTLPAQLQVCHEIKDQIRIWSQADTHICASLLNSLLIENPILMAGLCKHISWERYGGLDNLAFLFYAPLLLLLPCVRAGNITAISLTIASAFSAEQYALPYTASTDLSVLMLNNFLNFLDQTDVTQVTWAQYMDVTCCNGTGLLDYYGNARPSWHSFKFWGDIPTERVVSFFSLRSHPWNWKEGFQIFAKLLVTQNLMVWSFFPCLSTMKIRMDADCINLQACAFGLILFWL